jgi:iron complex transport system permease protein
MSKFRKKMPNQQTLQTLRRWGPWALLLLMLVTFLAGVVVGPVTIPISDALTSLFGRHDEGIAPTHRLIVTQIRLPRVLLGLLVGAALAVSGTAMQGLFRNPLASPYVLGIASGASAGAALVILLGARSVFLLPFGAFLGGAAAVCIVYRLARGRDRRTSIFTLILAGVAVGALFSAVTSFLIFLGSGGERLSDVLFWIMGGLGRANWTSIALLAPIVGVGIAAVFFFARDLNALSMGEEGAFHLGVNPDALSRWLLAVTTLLTSAAVAMAGTVGFIGLVIPHVMRLLVGPDHRVLIPVSALAGACFLVWSDLAARMVAAPAELPVGVITAFLGAPFFLYLLRTRGARL